MMVPVPAVTRISDPSDPRVQDYAALRQPERRMRLEGERGLFVAEGALSVATLLRSRRRVRSLLLLPRELERLAPELSGLDAPVYVADRAVLAAIAGFDVHRGVLAAADRFPAPPPDELLSAARRVLVLEGVGDHENLGALFRSAAGLGLDGVLLDPRCADPLYRRSVRVSLGHVVRVPFAHLDALPAGLDPLRRAGFAVVALTPAADALDIAEDRPAADDRLAILLGTEGPGLSAESLAAADRRVRIPLAAGVDSLNVAAAGAIAMHHYASTAPRRASSR